MQDNNNTIQLTWTDKDEQFPLDNIHRLIKTTIRYPRTLIGSSGL